MSFPSVRMRRLRRTPAMRYIMNNVKVNPSDFIYPVFVDENIKEPVLISSMLGCNHWPVDRLSEA